MKSFLYWLDYRTALHGGDFLGTWRYFAFLAIATVVGGSTGKMISSITNSPDDLTDKGIGVGLAATFTFVVLSLTVGAIRGFLSFSRTGKYSWDGEDDEDD